MALDPDVVRAAVEDRRVFWRRHALDRMMTRGISRQDVKDLLTAGEVIERYPEDWPYPSGLFVGEPGGRVLHVVAALSEEECRVYVITAYEPDLERFEADYRTRRRHR